MKREQVDEIFDTFLKSAAAQTLEEIYDEYIEKFPAEVQEAVPALDEKMKKVFRKAKVKDERVHHLRHMRRIAAMVLITLGVGALSIMQVDAWKVGFSNFVLEISDGKVVLDIGGDQAERQDRMLPDSVKLPEYMPNGFEVADITQLAVKTVIEFSDGSKTLTLEQEVVSELAYDEFTLSETSETVKINGRDGVVIIHDGMVKVIWKDDDYFYRVTGSLEQDEIVKIAESVK